MNTLRVLIVAAAFLGLSCGKGKKAIGPVTPVTFAVFGNVGLVTDNGLSFNELAGAVNRTGIDFAVDLGNRLPSGAPSSGLAALWEAVDHEREKFASPVYPVPGPNDVFDAASDVIYGERYGPFWYSFVRGGITFVVLHTGDESWRDGFGTGTRLGNEQIEWLRACMKEAAGGPVVLFMNRPVWNDAPALWRNILIPALGEAKTVLAVSSSPEGLYDWGMVDGIRAVSTGCVGPVYRTGPGLFPHALVVRFDGGNLSFRVLGPDGTIHEGIGVDAAAADDLVTFIRALEIPVVRADESWNISDAFAMKIDNTFGVTVKGNISFRISRNTSWSIEPSNIPFDLEPGASRTFNVTARATSPDLGPHPVWTRTLSLGDRDLQSKTGMLMVRIPAPRTGNPVPIDAKVPEKIPYAFDAGKIRIPVTVKSADLSGRLAVYRTDGTEGPVCVHISNLNEFRKGENEFVWSGRDLSGDRVNGDRLVYMVYIYDKKSPATWVADGPELESGAFLAVRDNGRVLGRTHTDRSLLTYRIGGSIGDPKPETTEPLDEALDGASVRGFGSEDGRRVFVSTDAGLLCTFMSGGRIRPDVSFADRGYLRFTAYRGRMIGSPACGGGKVYTGIGGGAGEGPSVIVADAASGKIEAKIDLEQYFGREIEPPAVAADENGVVVAHPSGDIILKMNPDGSIVWMNEPGDDIGDTDSDGRSFVYGMGSDRFGNIYATGTGTSARCGVIGPDGRGLFRVILVQLPGLRVGSVFPMIEGDPTDGLYFVTRGGDRPYIFHVPFTIRSGEIVRNR